MQTSVKFEVVASTLDAAIYIPIIKHSIRVDY